jgi:hypothetical protein
MVVLVVMVQVRPETFFLSFSLHETPFKLLLRHPQGTLQFASQINQQTKSLLLKKMKLREKIGTLLPRRTTAIPFRSLPRAPS